MKLMALKCAGFSILVNTTLLHDMIYQLLAKATCPTSKLFHFLHTN